MTRGKGDGRERHLTVDTRGLPVMMMATPADIHDAHATRDFLFRLCLAHPEVALVWADSATGGELVTWAKDRLRLTLKTVNRPKPKGFVMLPKRSVVERSITWIMRARRNCRDSEALPQHAEAHLARTVMTFMTRRLTKPVADRREPKLPPPPPSPPLRIRLRPWTVPCPRTPVTESAHRAALNVARAPAFLAHSTRSAPPPLRVHPLEVSLASSS
ncbi:transposase [Streptomyces sp. NPDC002643]